MSNRLTDEKPQTIKRVDDIELRWTHSFGKGSYRYMEVVQWSNGMASDKPYCFTLASWSKGKEEWDLHFIGKRPFDYHAPHLFFSLCKCGQAYLDAEFELERRLA